MEDIYLTLYSPISALESGTMPKNAKLETTTRLPSLHFDANVISVRGGLRSAPIQRCVQTKATAWMSSYAQNSAYVVEEGATRKDEDWNPEENGGYAVHGESALLSLQEISSGDIMHLLSGDQAQAHPAQIPKRRPLPTLQRIHLRISKRRSIKQLGQRPRLLD